MIVTTTNSVEGHAVHRYLGVVSAHVVAGTGLFSDVAASFSDIFGGRSLSYQRQVASIYEEALTRLQTNARRMRATAVVGVSVDVDEVSGGGKSMMMITATGTAVQLAKSSGTTETATEAGVIDHREVIDADKAARLAEGDPSKGLADADVDFLVSRQDPTIFPRLAESVRLVSDRYEASDYDSFSLQPVVASAAQIIDALRVADSAPLLREAYRAASGHAVKFFHRRIVNARAGDLDAAAEWLSSEQVDVRKRGTNLAFLPLGFEADDAEKMRALAIQVGSAFPDTSRTKQESGVMRTRAVTECGFCDGRIELGYCFKCKRDPRGFYRDEMGPEAIADHLRSRAASLERLVSSDATSP